MKISKLPLRLALLSVLIIVWTAGAVAATDDGPSPADKAVLENYQLSMDKLQHFSAADKALYGAAEKDPSLKTELGKMSDEEPQATIADLEAKLTRHPRVAAFYKKEGLSNADAVVIPLSTLQAITALHAPGTAQSSPAQAAFVTQHQKEIEAMLQEWSQTEDGED